jgi:hypothetical protein
MTQLDSLKVAFRACQGPYPWSAFATMIGQMGYEPLRKGKTGGSRRKFQHVTTKHKIFCHEPHDGEMGPKFVGEMQEALKRQGLL